MIGKEKEGASFVNVMKAKKKKRNMWSVDFYHEPHLKSDAITFTQGK